MQFDDLIEMMSAIPDEQTAIDHFTAIRWKSGAFCQVCGSTKVYHFSDRRTHKCGDCRKRFSIKVGTIFEDSKIEIRKWMMAIWLITSRKKGIASTQLAKDIGVTQKTAWFMTHRLRHAIRTKSFNRPLNGEVEIDETYVGGKAANRHKGDPKNGPGTSGKVPVIGALERGGNAIAMVIGGTDTATLDGFAHAVVGPSTIVSTDEHSGYRHLGRTFQHGVVRHSAGEFVKGRPLGLDMPFAEALERFIRTDRDEALGVEVGESPADNKGEAKVLTWEKNLSTTDAQQPTTGSLVPYLRLTSGTLDGNEFQTWFRQKFFSNAAWSAGRFNNKPVEEAEVAFQVNIQGLSLGEVLFKVTHDDTRQDSNNAPNTWLHWPGQIGAILQNNDFSGRPVVLKRDDAGTFSLEIQ